jgi:glutaredoxin
MNLTEIIILPASRCRRSQKILEYLTGQGIPFRLVELDSAEGHELAARYGFRASPGILVNGVSVNPFDLLVQPSCRVDEEKARKILMAGDAR